MIKFIRNKLAIPLLIIGVAVVAVFAYVALSIQNNVQMIAAAASNPPTPYYPPYPATNAKGHDATLIKKGEYLVKQGDCIACHTNTVEKGKPFAGGLPMATPFGTIYSPNLTPDKTTGIGNWTDAQFIKAMHDGISPQGKYYYPAFPYLYFNKVSIEDLHAIKAYLDSIPAVQQENRKNTMVFPFNFRIFQLGWRLLFFHAENTGPYQMDLKHDAEWNQGAYLVAGLGHCAMCHTPSYHLGSDDLPLGAPIRKYDLTGAKVAGYLAPDISGNNLGQVALQDIVNVFSKDELIGGGKVLGPMLEVNRDSLSNLSPQDLQAIAVYLKTVRSQKPPQPKASSAGAGTYGAYCAGCHEQGAGGAPKYGDAADWNPRIKKGVNTLYNNAIHGINGMPAKGTFSSGTDEQIKQAVDYMLASVQGKSSVGSAVKVKRLTIADGEKIYKANCSVCHESGFKGAAKPGDSFAFQASVKAGFINTYEDVKEGKNGHPVQGACPSCTDAELMAATQYMLSASAPDKNYDLW